MELQDDGVTLGLENSISKDIISIINNVFQAPWGGSHTCQKDEKAVECGLCQSSILCYQLGFELLEQLAPKEEIRLVVSIPIKGLYYWCAETPSLFSLHCAQGSKAMLTYGMEDLGC